MEFLKGLWIVKLNLWGCVVMVILEDLRVFDVKKGEVYMGKLFFMFLDFIVSYIFYVYNK